MIITIATLPHINFINPHLGGALQQPSPFIQFQDIFLGARAPLEIARVKKKK